jgi:hypothetical protein
MMGLDYEKRYRQRELHAAMAQRRLAHTRRFRTQRVSALRGKAGGALIALGERLQARPAAQPNGVSASAHTR